MTSALLTAVSSALTVIKGDVVTLLEIAIPAALIIFGIIMAVRLAKRGFSIIAGR